jgi:hypothetical protein
MTTIGAEFCDQVAAALQSGELDSIPDDALRRVLSAAIKAYAAKAEAAEDEFAPCRPPQPVRHRHVVPAPCGKTVMGERR